MKLRIKGNSIRYRLSRSEVAELDATGYLEERTVFGKDSFVYALQRVDEGTELSASLDQNKITLFVPASLLNGWAENDIVGFNAGSRLTGSDSLYLLLEKDFICIDESTEDQSDNYENPNKAC